MVTRNLRKYHPDMIDQDTPEWRGYLWYSDMDSPIFYLRKFYNRGFEIKIQYTIFYEPYIIPVNRW